MSNGQKIQNLDVIAEMAEPRHKTRAGHISDFSQHCPDPNHEHALEQKEDCMKSAASCGRRDGGSMWTGKSADYGCALRRFRKVNVGMIVKVHGYDCTRRSKCGSRHGWCNRVGSIRKAGGPK